MGFRPVLKGLLFYVVFLLLNSIQRFAPIPALYLITGQNESNYQHYKAAFFVYLIVTLVEYLARRRTIHASPAAGRQYMYSRLAAISLLPWIIFILWYSSIAVYGRWPSIPLEIVWSNLMTVIAGVCMAYFERSLETATYARGVKAVLLALFVISIVEYLSFSVRLPWADVFVEPNWRESWLMPLLSGVTHV